MSPATWAFECERSREIDEHSVANVSKAFQICQSRIISNDRFAERFIRHTGDQFVLMQHIVSDTVRTKVPRTFRLPKPGMSHNSVSKRNSLCNLQARGIFIPSQFRKSNRDWPNFPSTSLAASKSSS